MTSITYDEIFSAFLGNVEDLDLQNLNKSDAYQLMGEYLHKTLSTAYVRRLFSSCTLDDEVQTFSFEMELADEDEEADKEFVITAIALWMTYEWLHRQVQSVVNIKQAFMGKEQKYYSQSAHIAELRGLRDDAYKAARGFIMDRGWISNSYLNGGGL